jgi:hypothetical protein
MGGESYKERFVVLLIVRQDATILVLSEHESRLKHKGARASRPRPHFSVPISKVEHAYRMYLDRSWSFTISASILRT